MIQNFFTDTLMSRFIKRLLRTAHIPRYDYIEENEYMVKDCKYVYQDMILICTKSGTFGPGGSAEYISTATISETNPQTTYSYHSRQMYYDSDTHYHLGQYLRMIKNTSGLNLLPFYNCFNYKMVEGISLHAPSTIENAAESVKYHYRKYSNAAYKELAIPVKFGKTYTVAIDSPTTFEYGLLIHSETGLVQDYTSADSFYSNYLVNTYGLKTSSEFTKPFIFNVPAVNMITDDPYMQASLYNQQKNLYLILQIPLSNESSVAVLEGNYIDSWTNESAKYKNLKLLEFNSRSTYAFSSRLIEYLLGNVICCNDDIGDNLIYFIERIKKLDSTIYPDIINRASKINTLEWTDEYAELIRYIVSRAYRNEVLLDPIQDNSSGAISADTTRYTGNVLTYDDTQLPDFTDLDGNINSDIERLVTQLLAIKQ